MKVLQMRGWFWWGGLCSWRFTHNSNMECLVTQNGIKMGDPTHNVGIESHWVLRILYALHNRGMKGYNQSHKRSGSKIRWHNPFTNFKIKWKDRPKGTKDKPKRLREGLPQGKSYGFPNYLEIQGFWVTKVRTPMNFWKGLVSMQWDPLNEDEWRYL